MVQPTEIKLLQKDKVLELTFDSGEHFVLSCEYLRVFSPSAEVRGHGLAEPKLVFDKQDVNIIGIDPVGHYAIKLIFDDGHSSGIYSWETLYDLAKNHAENWQRYQTRLQNQL
jgi:DUF971 family protein